MFWLSHAERAWDCNGLAEGFYKDKTGIDINTYARSNYANWCTNKGEGKIPASRRVPGAAVFVHSKSAGYITHVGFLLSPIDPKKPEGDWWIGEAKGVLYGVVRTKLSAGSWNRWGLMTRYFDYANEAVQEPKIPQLGDRLLKKGIKGEDVKALQSALIGLGYNLGTDGADGVFATYTDKAVRLFQKRNTLIVDGEYGPKSHRKLTEVLATQQEPAGA